MDYLDKFGTNIEFHKDVNSSVMSATSKSGQEQDRNQDIRSFNV